MSERFQNAHTRCAFFNRYCSFWHIEFCRLHVACGVGASTHVIDTILQCYPEAVIMRTSKGSTAKQCLKLTKANNKAEVQVILKKYHVTVDAQFQPAQQWSMSDLDMV